MSLSPDQVAALAPDTGALSAARKLATRGHWKNLGRSREAAWGECQGSALYQVRADLKDLASKCSCPSRKFPCKHSLGLLLLLASDAAALADATPPEWVEEWLKRRGEAAARKETRKQADTPADPAAAARRAEKRQERIAEGLAGLDLWMCDLLRNGLASIESQPRAFEGQAARLVDAQAPALATRLRRLSGVPRSSPDWPERLLFELGRVALLSHAFRRLDSLDPLLRTDVLQLLGVARGQEDVLDAGERAEDDWLVLGQWIDEDDRVRVQRSWLRGVRGRRSALVLQFSVGGAPFVEPILPGTHFKGTLAFWPSAFPQRALVAKRETAAERWKEALPGHDSVRSFLTEVASALARQPWLERFACSLRGVTPLALADGSWRVVDSQGETLPLWDRDHYRLLALSGGRPLEVAGEWDGEALRPLGAVAEGAYEVVWRAGR